MIRYDEKFCLKILKRHGWEPVIPNGHKMPKDWISLAIQIATLEVLSKK